jgi:hypothetical protein
MGEGLVLSIPLEMSHLHRTWPGNRESHPTSFTKVPNAGFAAHNAAGDFLNGAVKNGKVKLPGTELCYTFEKNGKKFSAAWCITGKSNMTLDLPNGVSCRVYDLYGNLEKSASKPVSGFLRLNSKYIETEKTKFKDLKPFGCDTPAHPLPRREDAEYRCKILKKAQEAMGCSGSEGGWDFACDAVTY